MPFETFKRNSMVSLDKPAVTIQKRGALSFNAAAYEALENPKHVVLLYDRDNELMGIQKASASTPHAYVVRGVGNNRATHVVSGKAFLNYYGISREVARRWTAKMEDDVLVVDLKRPGFEVSGHSS